MNVLAMERHKCKLCFRVFPNGRALGGHMKAHLSSTATAATFPLLPKSTAARRRNQLVRDPAATESSSSSSYEEEEEEKTEQISKNDVVAYGLRENPRKSFRVADPEYLSSSETESRNPTRRRSKRTRKSKQQSYWATESPPVSSVSDACPEDEDVAMCLVMLSRDVNWRRKKNRGFSEVGSERETNKEEEEEGASMEVENRGNCGKKLQCEKCMKQFRSSQALGSHRRICSLNNRAQLGNPNLIVKSSEEGRIFQCPCCFKVFGSGQALGGHKRSHLAAGNNGSSSYPWAAVDPSPPASTSTEKTCSFWDLNLPAPAEEDEFSVVSDA